MLRIAIRQTPVCLLLKLVSGLLPFCWEARHFYGVADQQIRFSSLTITVQPVDQADCKGNKATFSVFTEYGSGPVHYQWKRKRPVDPEFAAFGARDSLKLPIYNIGTGSEAPDGTLYQVTVSDQNSSVISAIAMLTVNSITGIAPLGVASYTLNQGENLWFKVQTNGNIPSGYQWIKKQGTGAWRDLADNSIITGSQQNQLNFCKISPPDSGIYKLRVTFPTINGNLCIETSTITRKVSVIPVVDNMPPYFSSLSNETRILCPQPIEVADWNEQLACILPERTIYYRFLQGSPLFNQSSTNFFDNITPSTELILHWGIYTIGNPIAPILDNSGTILDDRIGQISLHPMNFDLVQRLPEAPCCQIIYWLEDGAGNLTPDSLRHRIYIRVENPPDLIRNF